MLEDTGAIAASSSQAASTRLCFLICSPSRSPLSHYVRLLAFSAPSGAPNSCRMEPPPPSPFQCPFALIWLVCPVLQIACAACCCKPIHENGHREGKWNAGRGGCFAPSHSCPCPCSPKGSNLLPHHTALPLLQPTTCLYPTASRKLCFVFNLKWPHASLLTVMSLPPPRHQKPGLGVLCSPVSPWHLPMWSLTVSPLLGDLVAVCPLFSLSPHQM